MSEKKAPQKLSKWNYQWTRTDPTMDDLKRMKDYCMFSVYDGCFVYGLSRKRVNEIPDAKSLFIKFLRRQLEIDSDLSLVYGILAFRGDGGDWYRNPTTMAAKFLRGTVDKIRQQRDDHYDPLKRVLTATKFDVRNDNFGKYKFRVDCSYCSNPMAVISRYYVDEDESYKKFEAQCSTVYKYNLKMTTETTMKEIGPSILKSVDIEIEPWNWNSVDIDSIDKSDFQDMSKYLLFSAIDGKVVYGLPRSVLGNVEMKRLLGKFLSADQKMQQRLTYGIFLQSFMAYERKDLEASEHSSPWHLELATRELNDVTVIRNSWREAFLSLLDKCNIAKDDNLGEKKFLVETPWFSNPLAVLNQYLLCGPSLTKDDLNDAVKLGKTYDKLFGLIDMYFSAFDF